MEAGPTAGPASQPSVDACRLRVRPDQLQQGPRRMKTEQPDRLDDDHENTTEAADGPSQIEDTDDLEVEYRGLKGICTRCSILVSFAVGYSMTEDCGLDEHHGESTTEITDQPSQIEDTGDLEDEHHVGFEGAFKSETTADQSEEDDESAD